MEQKTSAIKTASKVISVITKIGYTVMTVMLCICAAMLIFLGVTGGESSKFKIGETNIIIFDNLNYTPNELTSYCFVLIVMGGIFFSIFLLAYKMFNEISKTGEPFMEKYINTVRIIGILTAAMPIATGFTEFIVSIFTKVDIQEDFSDVPGIVVGAIIFCLSYFIDYGCSLKKQLDTSQKQN